LEYTYGSVPPAWINAMNSSLADAILVVHALFVLFVTGGLVATWIGIAAGARFARNHWFRGVHLAAIAFVVAESLLGYACPLTVWEDALRGGLQPGSFVGRWMQRLLYYQAPEWLFTLAYGLWTAATLLTLWLAPPRRRAA
jgi:uncharacterized protein DUF2784